MAAKHRKIRSIFSVGTITLFVFLRVATAQTSTATGTKKEHPSVWIVKHPKARIAGIALGHDARTHDLPEFKQLLVNAANWAARK